MSALIVHGGGIALAAAHYGGQPQDWLDLSTGLNPCPPALPDLSARVWHRLPDEDLLERTRRAARDFYRSGETLPLAVPGTQSVIQLLPKLADRKRPVTILAPTYGEYGRVMEASGFRVDPVADLTDIDSQSGLVVIVNPNNPTGGLYPADTLLALADQLAGEGGLLVVDEAFGDGVPEESLAAMAGSRSNLLVFRSFGKFFGMAGIRLGFVIAGAPILERLADWLGPWAVSGPALGVAVDLLSADPTPLRDLVAARRAGLQRVLSGAGLTIEGSTHLFALVADPCAAELHEHLCRAHILTRRFDYAPTWLRFGLTPDEAADSRLATALSGWRLA
ncbi:MULTISPECIES: threonine-phosphate decarboxylase CobD [Alphaproteobacteria]|uniref:threonine-phosphate decarboxylase n=2 Tax=Alphaproteobacteria TaxID=28211 RepID=A0A512HHV0_9HYPH|nr:MULTISPECIES: threonine-phosphate decarboxylase CobD [Alphaproteobacteria]GEO85019.1 threonine-phosphate decarboxylase [Ciceribacter naphthalenivorans]GLR22953.1 threonine-phosphate decarboxylase [Ciceribacter naphthalenivorans]GLT05809.1 threonine-phosphate decarboxylase [Sphingomonas psychrolutea]